MSRFLRQETNKFIFDAKKPIHETLKEYKVFVEKRLLELAIDEVLIEDCLSYVTRERQEMGLK